jgi:hypothetical protein
VFVGEENGNLLEITCPLLDGKCSSQVKINQQSISIIEQFQME